MRLKEYILKNRQVRTIHENENYEYVIDEKNIIFALAKNSTCESCVYSSDLKYFEKIKNKL